MQDDEPDPLADHNASPLNPLPGAVWLLVLAMAAIEAALWAGGTGLVGGPQAVGWRIEVVQRYAFSGAIQDWMLHTRQFPAPHLLRYATFSFVHGAPQHALFGVILVAALGKVVGEAFDTAALLVLALVTPALAALVFGLIVGGDQLGWLFGAMPMAFALVGAFTWLKWVEAAGVRDRQRRAFALIGVLLAARLGFGLLIETGPAWIAEGAAFVLGFALSAGLLGPGRWAVLRARLRRRG